MNSPDDDTRFKAMVAMVYREHDEGRITTRLRNSLLNIKRMQDVYRLEAFCYWTELCERLKAKR